VIVRDTTTQRAVAVQQLTMRAGFINVVRLYPASTRQLANLPAELR
jgi:hypothetical protein